MITIKRKHWLFNDRLIFFASESELQRLIQNLSSNDFLRGQTTTTDLSKDIPALIHRETIRILCIDLTKDIEDILREMHPTSTRYRIRKAEKMDDNIQIRTNDIVARKDFFNIYNSFLKSKGHTFILSEKRFKEYLKFADVFVLYFDERPICGRLNICDDSVKRVRGVFAVSTHSNHREDAKLSGILNRYLTWHEFKTYKAKGMELYDFGRIDQKDSLTQYKRSFGGFPVEGYSYIFAGALAGIGYKSFLRIKEMYDRCRMFMGS